MSSTTVSVFRTRALLIFVDNMLCQFLAKFVSPVAPFWMSVYMWLLPVSPSVVRVHRLPTIRRLEAAYWYMFNWNSD
jgi:hypothetical protein